MSISEIWHVYLVLLTLNWQSCYQDFRANANSRYRLQGKSYAGLVERFSPEHHQWLPVCFVNLKNSYAVHVCIALNFTDPAYQGHQSTQFRYIITSCILSFQIILLSTYTGRTGFSSEVMYHTTVFA